MMRIVYQNTLVKINILMILLTIVTVLPVSAQVFPEGDIKAYIDEVDAVYFPEMCKARMAITDTYSSGEDRTTGGFIIRKDDKVVFILTAPPSQKNFALLRIKDLFYQRYPTTGKVVKTSATANARGGETANLDLTRFNTNDDYNVKYLGEETLDGKECYHFELKAKNRKLAYSLVYLWVEKKTKIIIKRSFHAVSDKVLKYYQVKSVTMEGGRVTAIETEYTDALKPENTSRVKISDITPVKRVPDQFFTREYLESGRLYPFDF
jgi:outer membrane lipoprotein-sorting protein